MAVQRSRRSRLAGDLCRNAAYESGVAGADQQDRPQRCAWHRPDDAGGALSPGACEDVAPSETADAADPSQVAAEEGDRLGDCPARPFAQLWHKGEHGGAVKV